MSNIGIQQANTELMMMMVRRRRRSDRDRDRDHDHQQSNYSGMYDADDDPRANALRKLRKLRMKRKAETDQDGNGTTTTTSPPTSKSRKISIPPTPPPALEVNATAMQFLFEKKLKYSDVKKEGRIVVPKAFAEKYMPSLEANLGGYVFMDDMSAVKIWMFRYRFWQNNSSRVYVLENTGELIKAYGLQAGDFIMIYQNKETQRYGIGVRKSGGKDLEHYLMPNPKAAAADDHLILTPSSIGNIIETETSTSTESGCSSNPNNIHGDGGGLHGFPFHLLNLDISDLPEY